MVRLGSMLLALVSLPPAAAWCEEKSGEGAEKPPPPAAEEEGVEEPSPQTSANLKIPADLTAEQRQALEAAIAAHDAARKATSGQDKLLTKAITDLKSASGKVPRSPLPFYYLGIAYQTKRNYSQAKTVLEKAVKLQPKFHEAIVELADVHAWQKKHKESLAVYDQALAIAPDYGPGHERKALVLIELGQLEAAKKEMQLAQKARPTLLRTRVLVLLNHELKGVPWPQTFTVETENYKVMTAVSEEYAREIANHAELIRRAYNVVFSDIPKPERKYVIVLHPDKDSYHKFGGPKMAVGHYDPGFRKLSLFKDSKRETLNTLYHEAFHQYLHDYVRLAPQWFNEGLGEYFASFEYSRQGKQEKMFSRPNKGRLNNAQHAISARLLPPASDLMVMTQAEMYNPDMAALHYAQAWAIVYFIIEGNKPQYKRVLIDYFNALRKGKDLNEAYALTFGRIDMAKFDAEWKGYIANLRGN